MTRISYGNICKHILVKAISQRTLWAVSLFFHIWILVGPINSKYRLFQNPWDDSYFLGIFQDDRSYWLKAATTFAEQGNFGNESWQLSLWTPGHILLSTIFYLISNSLLFTLLLDYSVNVVLTTLVLKETQFLLPVRFRGIYIFGIGTFLFLFSPIYRSSLIDTFFMTDLQATLAGSLAILLLLRILRSELEAKIINLIAVAALICFAGYVRLSYYQLTLYVFVLSVLALVIIRFFNLHASQEMKRKFWISFKVSLLAVFIFLPWIIIRGFVIYPGNFAKGVEFSLQGRFALQSMWYDKEKLQTEPQFPFIGEGIACKVDKIKCNFFSDQNAKVASGGLSLTMDQQIDIKARAAVETFLRHPTSWISLKAPVYGPSFFQESVYDRIDTKKELHFSWDRILILMLFLGNPILLLTLRLHKVPILTGTFALILMSYIQLIQFLLTQLLFRFYLPAISFTLMASILLFASINSMDKSIAQTSN